MSAARRLALPAVALAATDGALRYNGLRVAYETLDASPETLQYVNLGITAASFLLGTLAAVALGYLAVGADDGEVRPSFVREYRLFALVAVIAGLGGYLVAVVLTLSVWMPPDSPTGNALVLAVAALLQTGRLAVAAFAGGALAAISSDRPGRGVGSGA